MIHPIFPSRKPRTDALIFALGVLSLVACFLLRDYWVFKPLPNGFQERLETVTDSVLAKSGMTRDSVEMMTEASVDTDMLDKMKSQFGASVRHYLDTADAQQVLYRIKIRKKEKGSSGINFSAGNRPRSRTKSGQNEAEEMFSRTLWVNEHGNVVGETQRLSEDLLPNKDTNALRERLLHLIPQALLSEGLVWKSDTTDNEKIGFVALIVRDSLLKKEMVVSANKVSTSPPVWSVEWQRRVSLVAPVAGKSENGDNFSPKTIVTIIFWVLIILSILALLGVWVNRLRIKAINTWILSIALLSGISMTLYSLGIADVPWYAFAIVFVFYTLGFGFFFIAVPIAGTVSVMREVFAEKFYTLMRFREKPLSSFHLGRMLLLGISVGAMYSALITFLPYFGERFGLASFANVHLTANYYTFPFLMRSAFPAFLNIIGTISPISFVFLVAPPLLAYRFVMRKYAPFAALGLSSLAWGLFQATQDMSFSAVFVEATLHAGIGFAVLYFTDVLAVLSFVIIESFLISFGLFAGHPLVALALSAILGIIVVIGIIAYRNAPEVVNEADYKPSFLSLLEENARMHQEIAAAKSVQQKLLPRSLPAFDSVVVSAACIPAYEVGGDYYDFFPLDDKRLGVLIGDVSGKGISAAFYITLAKGVIVSQVRGSGSPSDVLHRVNALLYGVMERGKFVSMIYGIYNTETREFAFSNAGHNPLVVRRTSGEMSTISAKGMAIGLDKGERFERAVTTASVTLEKGDCILLYTDGVTEAMNTAHAEYGEERMMQAVQTAPLNAADIVSAALADVRKFAGKAHQHDDITLVALQAV